MSRRKQSNPKPIKHDGSQYGANFADTERSMEASFLHHDDSSHLNSGSDGERGELCYSSDHERLRVPKLEPNEDDVHDFNVTPISSDRSIPIVSDSPNPGQLTTPQSRSSRAVAPNDTDYSEDDDDDSFSLVRTGNNVTESSATKLFVRKSSETRRDRSPPPSRDAPNGRRRDADLVPTARNHRQSHESDSGDSSSQVPIPGRKILEKDLASHLQLPSDVLYLQKEKINIHGTTSVGWIVCTTIPLPQGSSLGPFQGQQVSPSTVKVGDLIIQLTNRRGQQALINVAGQSGGWLALLRTPTSSATRNTHVYLEGGRIWCEIVADIEVGTELRATFTFQNEDDEDTADEWSTRSQPTPGSETATSLPSQQVRQQSPTPGHAALIYGCPFCGVRFSSPRTLQGHLSFYCSKKTSDLIVTPAENEQGGGGVQSEAQVEEDTAVFIKQEDPPPLSPNDDMATKRNPPPPPPPDNNTPPSLSENHPDHRGELQNFKCKHCSYMAEKLSSLNRHMRIHKSGDDDAPGPSMSFFGDQPRTSALKSPSTETFCKDCRIQFSSIRTYRCHKDHYCAQRRKKLGHVPVMADTPAYAIFPPGVIFPQAPGVDFSPVSTRVRRAGRISISDDDSSVSGTPTPLVLPSPILTASTLRKSGFCMTNVKGAEEVAKGRACIPRPVVFPDMFPARSESRSRRERDGANSIEKIEIKEPGERSDDRDDEHNHRESYKEGDDHPLDLTVTKKSNSPSKSSTMSKEQLMMNHDYQEANSTSPSTSTSSFDTSFIKAEPGSRPSSSSDQIAIQQINQKLSGSSQDIKSSVPIPSSLTSMSESPPHGPVPLQMIPHPSVLVPSMAFLPASALPLVSSTPEKLPISPSGISKCNDCNIVFYKHENYLVHRQYYCSGNRQAGHSHSDIPGNIPQMSPEDVASSSTEREDTPSQTRDRDSPIEIQPKKSFSPNADPREDNNISFNDVKYKYYCVPCRIKFSNASILAAHKEYYCPAGKDSEQSVVAHASSSQPFVPSDNQQPDSPEAAPQPQEFSCSKCRSVFATARLLRLHLCDGGFPCPHCDHVAVTENRLAEHIKVHAPTRAFRCTICGYRGNTARGMRMHGKTHIDEGIDFTNENMLEYHEPALMPVIPTLAVGQNSDSELLRIKNEPYKRRRSRKAYEKFDFPQAKVDIPQTCPLCGQSFPNSESLGSHFKVHEIAASQYMAGFMKCLHCDYVGRSPEDLRAHFESNHARKNRKRTRTPSCEDDDSLMSYRHNSSSRSQTSGACRDTDESDEVKVIKRESPDEEIDSPFDQRERRGVVHSNQALATARDSSDSSQEINSSMIPTTVKEEEIMYNNKNKNEDNEGKESLNFLNIKRERLTPPEIVFPNQVHDPFQQTTTRPAADHHSSSRGVTPNGSSSSPPSPSQSPRRVSKKSPDVCGKELCSDDNFLVNIKEEPGMDLSPSPSNSSKAGREESSRNVDSRGINGYQDSQSPERPRPVLTPPPRSAHGEDGHLPSQSRIPQSPEIHSGSSRVFTNVSPPSFYHHHHHHHRSHQHQHHHNHRRHPMSRLLMPSSLSPADALGSSGLHGDETKRYCQHCDIFFSRHATYLAHKKHYCRGVVRAEKQTFVHA